MSTRFCTEKPGLKHVSLQTKACPFCGNEIRNTSTKFPTDLTANVINVLDSDEDDTNIHPQTLKPVKSNVFLQQIQKPPRNHQYLFDNRSLVEEARSTEGGLYY